MPDIKVIVIFRTDKEGTFALFPEEVGNMHDHTCLSYQHLGQHGTADLLGCIYTSRPAKEEQKRPLAQELQSIGYKLEERKRVSYQMHRERERKLGNFAN